MIWLALVALSASDRDFAQKATTAGMFDVKAAELALTRSKSDQVKSVARHLLEDQEASNDELKRIAVQEGIVLPEQLTAEQERLIGDLRALSGNDFDQVYLAQQRKADEDAILLFQHEMTLGQDVALKSFALQKIPTLRTHYEMVIAH